MLGYGNRGREAQKVSFSKENAKTTKRFKNDGRAPDTAEALLKLNKRSKRHLPQSSTDSGVEPPRERRSDSKRKKSDTSSIINAESTEVLVIESSEPESHPDDDTSDEDDFFGPNFLLMISYESAFPNIY